MFQKTRTAALKIASRRRFPAFSEHIEIQQSSRKTMAIYVRHLKVEVRTPLRASPSVIEHFLGENEAWIQQRLVEESRRYQEVLRVEHGSTIFYRARELTIVFREGRKNRILLEGSEFIIQGHKLNNKKASEQLQHHLREQAQQYLPQRSMALAKYLGVSDKISEIRFRKTRSKWGHCTSTGILQFNWLIMLAPHSIIDYMITHEVCHLRQMNHSKKFWKLVESVCPDYQHYIKWLKDHEHRFWF